MINVRALKAGLRIAEVPSFEHERIHGLSNLRALPDGWRILKTIVREWVGQPAVRLSGAGRAAEGLKREVGEA